MPPHRGRSDRRRWSRPCLWLERLEDRLAPATWSGDVFDTTPGTPLWTNTEVQQIVGDVHVPAGKTLTIQPGTVIKFDNGKSLTVDGTLKGPSAAGAAITFTSYRDGNNAAPGDWGAIQLNAGSDASVLDNVVVKYGGYSGATGTLPGEVVIAAPVTLSHSTLSDSYGPALLRINGSNPTLSGDTFSTAAGHAAVGMTADSQPAITAPSVSGPGTDGVVIDGGATLSGTTRWNNPGIFYQLAGTLTVAAGGSLEIDAGQTVRVSGGQSLVVNGTLTALGTAAAPVTFTSYRDGNNAAAGDWGAVQLNAGSGASVLDNVVVKYGGFSSTTGALPGEVVIAAPITLSHATLSDAYGPALLRVVSSSPTLSNDTFVTAAGHAAVGMTADSQPSITAPTVSGTGTDGVVLDGGATLSGVKRWNNPEIFYQLAGTITVGAGASLEIDAGQTVRVSNGASLVVNGTLHAAGTAASLVTFTSYRDGNNAAPGDWGAIQLNAGSDASVLDNVVVKYGGYSGATGTLPGEVVIAAPVTLSHSTLSDSYGPALLRINGSNPTLTTDAFITSSSGSQAAIGMTADSQPVIAALSASGPGVGGVLIDGGTLSGSARWNNPSVFYQLAGTLTVGAGGSLEIDPGQTVRLKYFDGNDLVVNGTLRAVGTAASPVTFTSYRDGNGAAAGDWGAVQLNAGSGASVLDHVVVKYGGYSSGTLPGEVIVAAPVTLSHATLSDSSGLAVLRINGSNPTLSNDTLITSKYSSQNAIGMTADSQPAITAPSVSGIGVNGVVIDAGTLSGNVRWNNPALFYQIDVLTVGAAASLEIDPGQTVRVGSGYSANLVVNGTLRAVGTAASPVTFTSYRDGNGAQAGDWGAVQFNAGSDASTLDNVVVKYGGGVNGFLHGEVIAAAPVTLSNSTLSDSSSAAVRVTGSNPTLAHDAFRNNAGAAVSTDLASDPAIAAATINGNGTNGVLADGGTLSANLAWTSPGVVYSLADVLTLSQGVTLTIGPGAVFSANADLNAFPVPHNILGPGTLANSGTFLKSADATTVTVSAPFINTGTLEVDKGALTLSGGLTLNGSGFVTGKATASINVGGNLSATTQNADLFAPPFPVTLNGTGTAAAPQLLEAMSQDKGAAAAGFSQNFAYSTLSLSNNTYVKLVDGARNSAGTGAEALYVNTLVVPSGTTLNLNGLRVYARLSRISGTVVGGTVSTLPGGGPLALNVSTYSKLANVGDLDDWTFFGRAGQAVTVIAGTGSAGSPAPASPALNFAQVTLLDAANNVVATGSNTGSGADVTLAAVVLPSDGTYHIKVQAPSGHSTSTGNYVLTAYNATVQIAPLNVNQTTTGAIDTPFRIDHWTFTATANQLVRFNLVNVANSSVVFDLTGPNGYAAFTSAAASSGLIPLPSAGTYTVTVHSLQKQTGTYAFQIVESSPTALVLGTPLSQPIAGSGQAQYYQLDVAQAGQLSVDFQDAASADRTEVYASLGTLPTRADHQFQASTPAGANQRLLIPSAAPGTYFILVYDESASVGNFTLSANEGSFFVSGLTPDHASNAADATLTLTGLGFDDTATVSLVSSGGKVYPADETNRDLTTQVTATWAAGTVPAGVYSVKVALAGGASTTLPNAFTSVAGGQAHLTTKVIVPNPIGLHIASTLYVEYSNTGTAAMPAPLLDLTAVQNGKQGALMTLDPAIRVSGFWTAATPRGYGQSVQILASGATPGFLQPGEKVRVPVYYAGWLTGQWDFSRPPISFNLGVLAADSTAPVDWASLKSSLQPGGVSDAAWDGIYTNFTAQLGNTWGSVIRRLDQDAAYLARIGEKVADVGQLWAFEIRRANGLGLVPTLASAVDLAAPAVGLSLAVGRSFGSTIVARSTTGPFGNGWQLGGGWGDALAVQADGTVVIASPDGNQRNFQPDGRTAGVYFAPAGDREVLTNNSNGSFTLTGPTGLVTRFLDGRVASVQDANGNRITAGYTGGLLTGLTASSGQSIALTYNAAGRIVGLSNSLSQTASYAYDATNRYLLTATDQNGHTTGYTYDVGTSPATRNALLTVSHPDGTQQVFTYDAQGRLTATSAQGGAQAVRYGYGTGGTVTVTDSANATATYFLDVNGQASKAVDPLGRTTFYTYDATGHLLTAIDPTGAAYSNAYDAKGRRVLSTDPLGHVIQYTYGPLDTLTSATDAKGNTTRYDHDEAGDLTSTVYADGAIERAAYNPLGELTRSTDADKNVIDYAYNAAGQLTTKTYADHSQTVYAYDALGRLRSVQDATGTTTLSYDSANRLTQVLYPDGTFLGYSYDAAGRRTRMVDQTGFTVKYAYTALGQLAGLTDGADNPIVTYTYDAVGRLQSEAKGNGTSTQYTYDADGEVLSVVNLAPGGTTNSSFVYTYDALGHCTTETTLQGQWTYAYDATGQLTHAAFASNNTGQVPNQDLQYSYDAAGNRTSTVINGVTTTYTVNARNEYTQVGSTTNVYDPAGNLVSRSDAGGSITYTYNADGRLVAIHPPTGAASAFQYDAFGGLYLATQNGQQTRYLTDGLSVVGQFTTGGAVLAHYTQGLGLVSQVSAAGVSSFYDFDVRGSTVGLSNAAGAYTTTYAYLPFGGVQTAGSPSNPFQFVGKWGVTGLGTDLSLMGARAYDSSTGQFLADDPLGLAGGDADVRRYAGNNPVSRIDPLGLASEKVTSSDPQITTLDLLSFVLQLYAMADTLRREHGDHDKNDIYADRLNQVASLLLALVLQAIEKSPYTFPHSAKDAVKTAVEAPPAVAPPAVAPPAPEEGAPPGYFWDGSNPYLVVPVYGIDPPLPTPPADAETSTDTTAVTSTDPNAKSGPAGFGSAGFVDGSDQPFPYRIDFENDPTATAPAQRVTVSDRLNPNLDWSTFALTDVGFGDTVLSIPAGSQHFQATVPMTYNGLTFDVRIELGLHSDTGEVYADFESLDGTTSLPPPALFGFLPPEDGTGRGKGYFSYLVEPKKTLPTGTKITNVAVIKFDGNATIATDQIDEADPSKGTDPAKQDLLTIDADPPTSGVAALPSFRAPTFTVSWAGQDAGGSGVASYDVFVSDNGGPFTLFRTGTTATSATFTGQVGHAYGFYSVATDNVGYVQPTPGAAQATTTVVADTTPPTSSVSALPAFSPGSFTLRWSGSDDAGGSGVASYSVYVSTDGGAFQPFLLNTAQTSATFTGVDGHAYGFYSVATDVVGNREATPSSAQAGTRVDAVAPTSSARVAVFATMNPDVAVSWSGSDGGSGVASYDIFVSDNGGAFTPWQAHTTATSGVFHGSAGHAYAFYSVATDVAGNVQPTPVAQARVGVAHASAVLRRNGANVELFDPASNAVVASRLFTDATPLVITGSDAKADTLTIDLAGGEVIPAGATYQFVGGAGDGVVGNGDTNWTLTPTTLTDSAGGALQFSGVARASLVGGAGVNVLDATTFTGPVSFTGGLGNDVIKGGLGVNTLVESGNVNFTLSNTKLTGLGTDTLTKITVAQLTGGTGKNTLNVSAFTGTAYLSGGLGNDTLKGGKGFTWLVESGDVNFTLSNTRLVGLGTDTLTSIKGAVLTGGSGNNVFNVTSWTLPATLDGGGGTDTLVAVNNANMTLTDTSLTRTSRSGLTLANFESAQLTGGAGNNVIDATGFSGSTLLSGGAGNDTLRASRSASILLGGTGNDTLVGNAGRDLVFGGTGTDSLAGGDGDDVLINGTTKLDANLAALLALKAEWTRTDVDYAGRVAHLRDGGGLNGTTKLNRTAVLDDLFRDALQGGSGADWFWAKVPPSVADTLLDLEMGETLN